MAQSIIATQEKNKLGTDSVFLVLLEVHIPGVPTVRITNNSEDVTWREEIWLSFPFEISDINEGANGEIPQWVITMDNRQRVMEKYLQDYDYYLKINGIEGNEIFCNCYITNSKDLANTEAIKEVYFELSQPTTTSEVATFTLTANSPFRKYVPRRKYLKLFCAWKFKSVECGYTGTGDTCDKGLVQCRAYGNSARFGGFPSVGFGGIRL